jgi:hypothetical protein
MVTKELVSASSAIIFFFVTHLLGLGQPKANWTPILANFRFGFVSPTAAGPPECKPAGHLNRSGGHLSTDPIGYATTDGVAQGGPRHELPNLRRTSASPQVKSRRAPARLHVLGTKFRL